MDFLQQQKQRITNQQKVAEFLFFLVFGKKETAKKNKERKQIN